MASPAADQNPTSASEEPKTSAKAGYAIGHCRPPKHCQWRPGQSGNPRGRPRGRPSKRDILDKLLNEPMLIREDGKTRRVTRYEGLLLAQLNKGIKGDARNAKFIIDEMVRAGIDDEPNDAGTGDHGLVPTKSPALPTDMLFQNLDYELLSEQDQTDLARVCEIIDLGGDVTALSSQDFARLKEITNKGRGKDVTHRGDAGERST